MMNNLLIDSNVFISSFLRDEKFHQISMSLLTHIRSKGEHYTVILPRVVAIEVINILFRKTLREREIQSFLAISAEDSRTILMECDQKVQTIAQSLLPKFHLKTLDLIIAASAFLSRSILISWDKPLLKACSAMMECYTPDKFFALRKKKSRLVKH